MMPNCHPTLPNLPIKPTLPYSIVPIFHTSPFQTEKRRKMKGRALFVIFIVLVSTMPPSIACGYCPPPKGGSGGSHKPPPKGKPPGGGHKSPPKVKPPPSGGSPSHPKPPVVKPPPVVTPPIVTPPVVKPPPSGGYPPYTPTPPSGGSPIIPPVTPISPPVTPITPPGTPVTPPGSSGQTCPKDALKLGACVDLLGGLVHVGIGDPAANTCCPLLQGLLALEAAVCLCTAIRLKLLNLNIYLPIALQLLATCGQNPPAGFTCPAN